MTLERPICCSRAWMFWLSFQYLPDDLLERRLWGSLTVVRRSSPQSRGRRVYDFWLSVLFHCFIVCLSCPRPYINISHTPVAVECLLCMILLVYSIVSLFNCMAVLFPCPTWYTLYSCGTIEPVCAESAIKHQSTIKVGLLLMHGSRFGQVPFLTAPVTHMGTGGSWTQACWAQVHRPNHRTTAAS